MKLKDEKEVHYQHWCSRLLQLTWWFILLLILTEMAAFMLTQGEDTLMAAGFLDYWRVLQPGAISIVILAAVHLLSLQLLKKEHYITQAVLYLTGASLIVFTAVWAHSDLAAVYCMFSFPVLIAAIYMDKWCLLYTFVLDMVLFLSFVVLMPYIYPAKAYTAGLFNVISTMFGLIGCFLISGMLLDRQAKLARSMVEASLQSKKDSLTGLFNHAAFYEQLDNHMLRQNATGEDFSVIVIDIDNFKRINDQFGHAVGDVVITTLVATIRTHLQEGAEAFRYGGEEFAILLDKPAKNGMYLATQILAAFRQTMSDDSWGKPVTASAGVCAYSAERFGGRREFFAAADEALYEAKRTGKDKAVLWTEEFSKRWVVFENAAQDAPPPPEPENPFAALLHK